MMENDLLTEKVIGCAFRVYNEMGFGFLESVYETCMLHELKLNGIRAQQQSPIKVFYRGELVGEFRADLLVENALIVELKSVRAINLAHEVQLVNYLTASRLDKGLLLNFGESKVEVKRKHRNTVKTI